MERIEKGEFFHFDMKNGKRVKRECVLHSQFYFSRHDFYLVERGGHYFVCLVENGNLISLWHCKTVESGVRNLPGEVISEFRKKWQRNKIDDERLSLFIENPIEYEKKFKPTKS